MSDSNEVTGHLETPIDYFDDINVQDIAPPATLERLAALAKEAKELEDVIHGEHVALEEKRAKLDKLYGMLIPNIMDELGMKEFKLVDGSKVEVKDDIRTSILVVNRGAAFDWLEKHDFDGIIKTKVISDFARGEMEKAQAAVDLLAANGVAGSIDRNIHAATLKSFVKERLAEAGEEGVVEFPRDLFGVYEFKVAKITLPKPTKAKK
jgi:hypothetical protein